jgi:hypothetical protein
MLPYLFDVPAMINGNYISVTGKVVTYVIRNKDDTSVRDVEILNEETEQCLRLRVYSCPDIDVEDVLTVKYLRYSKQGIAVDWSENSEQ